MESPLVSIIVPIYNAAMDMVPCLESIKHQRYQNLEVLLVNDGSSDASLEICRMYARLDPRVIIIDKENTGVSGTRNAAIERARGKYLQFVDSDDQLDPNATRLLVEAAEETQADLVICNYCSVMPDGKTTVHGFMQPYTRMDKAQFARCLMEEPASFYYGVMWNKLYRREIIMAHDIRCDEEFHLVGGYALQPFLHPLRRQLLRHPHPAVLLFPPPQALPERLGQPGAGGDDEGLALQVLQGALRSARAVRSI